ncbi:MAG: HlyD family efflux transporter periplasmic adaptor subunit (plasmid) [Leptolyngbya sp. BL-A-14]
MRQATLNMEWVEPIQWSTALPTTVATALPAPLPDEISVPSKSSGDYGKYTQSVSLRQSPLWSKAILWGLMGSIAAVVAWACLAQFEEAIPTQGQLKPQGAVKEVQAPIAGVVKAVYVKDGQRVKKGERLLSLDATAVKAQIASLTKIRATLMQENRFYQLQMAGEDPLTNPNFAKLQIPPSIAALTKKRLALLAENRTYRAQLNGAIQSGELSADEVARVQAGWADLISRQQAAQFETHQLERQREQAQIQLTDAKMVLAVNQKILNDMEPLAIAGAIGRMQYLKQVQEVGTRKAEIARLAQETSRLQFAIAQSQEQQQTISAQSERDLRMRLADNDKQIDEIDDQLNKAIVENEKRLAEIDSDMSQAQVSLKYQELLAPTDGVIFDLQARSPGFVAQASQPILKVVPDDSLTAEVFITNQDIGFVQQGMKVDVRVDSFPYSEFGDIKGELVWIGSDALPPTETRRFYSFPARIRLDRQSLSVQQRDVLLQSGMSIQANIKLRKRSVISILTELFTKQIDSLQSVR